ncbi:hypothetical protein LB503_013367 [Fusarium chuoi]|nr:hypothetical protein LB503_013367 [Fusarium chuoi]
MPSTTNMQDVERQVDSQEFKDIPDLRERAGQGAFLCLESHNQGQPTKASRIIGCTRDWDCTSNPKPIYEATMPWDSACESDDEIYRRLIDTCYQHLGWWKRWLPYFGITEVLEVNFQFAGFVESDGRCPIRMNPVDLKNVSEECERTIAKLPTGPYLDFNDTCKYQHSEQCLIGMEEWSQPCIEVEAEKAEQRRKRLLFVSHLKECAQDPARANGLYTLEGLAQESCIYEIKYV